MNNIRKLIFSMILGTLIVFLINNPILAANYPPPAFEQPDDSTIVQQKVPEKVDLIKCAKDCLAEKFPLDMILGSSDIPGADGCPRISFFAGTPGQMEWEGCILLNVLQTLSYPVIVGFAVKVLIDL